MRTLLSKFKASYFLLNVSLFVVLTSSPILSFAADSDNPGVKMLQRGVSLAEWAKVFIIAVIIAAGSFFFLAGVFYFVKTNTEGRFKKMIGCFLLAGICFSPVSYVTTINKSVAGSSADAGYMQKAYTETGS